MINERDEIKFRNKFSGTEFTAKVLVKDGDEFLIEIIKCDKVEFIGNKKWMNVLDARIEITETKPFETELAEHESQKHLALCHVAVLINDKKWFEECHAQYTLWKGKLKNGK